MSQKQKHRKKMRRDMLKVAGITALFSSIPLGAYFVDRSKLKKDFNNRQDLFAAIDTSKMGWGMKEAIIEGKLVKKDRVFITKELVDTNRARYLFGQKTEKHIGQCGFFSTDEV